MQNILFTLRTSSSVSVHRVRISETYDVSTVSATGDDKVLRNKIGQAIVERIKRAHYSGEKFKVYILIPLIPAFEGDLTASESVAAR